MWAGLQVSVIDYEWAGRVGPDTVYPFFMNTEDIAWPAGVQAGQPIMQEHDIRWLSRLLARDA